MGTRKWRSIPRPKKGKEREREREKKEKGTDEGKKDIERHGKTFVGLVECVRIKGNAFPQIAHEVNGRRSYRVPFTRRKHLYVFGTGCTEFMGKWPSTVGVCISCVAFLSPVSFVPLIRTGRTRTTSRHVASHTNFAADRSN